GGLRAADLGGRDPDRHASWRSPAGSAAASRHAAPGIPAGGAVPWARGRARRIVRFAFLVPARAIARTSACRWSGRAGRGALTNRAGGVHAVSHFATK